MQSRRLLLVVVALLSASATAANAQLLGTAFTYQGRLTNAGAPASGVYDFRLILYTAEEGGSQVGPIVTLSDIAVANGLFTATVDFGAVFAGSRRWLDVGVRPGTSTGSYTVLAPRQELTPTPNAIFASSVDWAGMANKPAGFADDVDNDTTYQPGSGLSLAGTVFSTDNTLVARKDAGAGSQAFDIDTLFLDYTNNRVGVGTAAPASGAVLDVNGIARAAGFAYTAAVTNVYRLSAFDFVPAINSVETIYEDSGALRPATDGVGNYFAPVHLPAGATITGISCDIFDNDPARELTSALIIYRRPSGAFNLTVHYADFGTTSGSNPFPMTKTSAFSAVVDAAYDYYVRFIMVAEPPPMTFNLSFFGCALSYTMPGPAY